MNRNILLFGIVFLVALVGCTGILPDTSGGSNNDDIYYDDYDSTERSAPSPAAVPMEAAVGDFWGEDYVESDYYEEDYYYEDVMYEEAPAEVAAEAPLKTKEAYISIEVERGELENKYQDANALLDGKGADIISVFYDEYSGIKSYSIEFKILPAQFDETLEDLKRLGEVMDINVDIEDVTTEYRDLNIRLNNKELELERLYELYDRSETVEELLAVEEEVTRVTTEIEQLKAQKETLEGRVAKSTITVEIYEWAAASEVQEGDITLKVGEGELETKLQTLKGIISDTGADISSLRFTETTMGTKYVVLVSMDANKLETFMEDVRTLGEIKDISTDVDEENRPEKSLVYVTLIEEKSPVQTNLFVPLEMLLGTFFGSFSAGILIVFALVGFLIPIAVLIWIAYAIYKRIKRGRYVKNR